MPTSPPPSDTLAGYGVEDEMGIVVGTSARSKSFIHDLIQRVRGVVGGSLADYEVSAPGSGLRAMQCWRAFRFSRP